MIELVDGIDDDAVQCARCRGTGEVAVNSTTAAYIGPGPVPEDAKGIVACECGRCRGYGYVAAKLQEAGE